MAVVIMVANNEEANTDYESLETGNYCKVSDDESEMGSPSTPVNKRPAQRGNAFPARLCVSACFLLWTVLTLHYFQWKLAQSSPGSVPLQAQLADILAPHFSTDESLGFPTPPQRRAMDWMTTLLPRSAEEQEDLYKLIQAVRFGDSSSEHATSKQETWLLEAFAVSSMMSDWGISPNELESASMPRLRDDSVPSFTARLCTKTPFLGCDDHGRITRLDVSLVVSSFQGTIPKELSLLTELVEVNLGQEGLTGTLPEEVFAAWTHLERLGIYYASHLQGPLPQTLAPTLTSLIIQESPGIEVSPSFLSRFQHLEEVELDNQEQEAQETPEVQVQ